MTSPNSSSRFAIDIGTVIADTYRIEAMIGRGGMGSVFLASHARLPGKQVAIKVLHAGIDDADVLARFRREAEIASRLGHPNIVGVQDFNVTPDGTPYLVLEYLRGITLADRIAAGPMSLEQTMTIIRQVGSALQAAHREGIVHRDLKPHNIFLVQTELDGTLTEVAKVLDFGISKIRGSQTVKTQETALLGTPQYMSPEQATGHHSTVDERTDIFAMGAIVHEMLTGTPAFTGASIPEVVFKVVYEPPAALPETIPPAISGAVKKAMSKAQPERFPSMSSFVEALTGLPLASPREIQPPEPPTTFAAGSKHTHNQAFASTVASGDHGPSMVKALHETAAAGGAGMASTAIGVAPAPAKPLAAFVATVNTVAPNAQQSLHGVAAEARANKVATDSRGLWKYLMAGVPIAAIAVVALVMFGGGKKAAAPENRATEVAVAEPMKTKATISTGAPVEGSGSGSSVQVAIATPTVDKPIDTSGDKPGEKGDDLSGKRTGTPKQGKKVATKAMVAESPAEDANADRPLKPALDAEHAGDTKQAMLLLNGLINNSESAPIVVARARFGRGRIHCKAGRQEAGGIELRWLRSNNFKQLADKLQKICDQ